jgi:hypothetical protein
MHQTTILAIALLGFGGAPLAAPADDNDPDRAILLSIIGAGAAFECSKGEEVPHAAVLCWSFLIRSSRINLVSFNERVCGRLVRVYFGTTPLSLMILAQLAISSGTYLFRYAGVRRSGATIEAPTSRSRASTTGVSSADKAAWVSFAAIGSGVPAGAKMPIQ